jgi:hypothetical protein
MGSSAVSHGGSAATDIGGAAKPRAALLRPSAVLLIGVDTSLASSSDFFLRAFGRWWLDAALFIGVVGICLFFSVWG